MDACVSRETAEIAVALETLYDGLSALVADARTSLAAGDVAALCGAVDRMVRVSTQIHALTGEWNALQQGARLVEGGSP
jgi:hypothetical protein